jgi:hypothetical protein
LPNAHLVSSNFQKWWLCKALAFIWQESWHHSWDHKQGLKQHQNATHKKESHPQPHAPDNICFHLSLTALFGNVEQHEQTNILPLLASENF